MRTIDAAGFAVAVAPPVAAAVAAAARSGGENLWCQSLVQNR
jgi:hypothetical protein